jgi:hypothetical protein
MAGLVSAIHAFAYITEAKDVDARDEPGHDELKTRGRRACVAVTPGSPSFSCRKA